MASSYREMLFMASRFQRRIAIQIVYGCLPTSIRKIFDRMERRAAKQGRSTSH